MTPDHTLDFLLDLDGIRQALDEGGEYVAMFEVRRVPATPERPHGLDYSLTLHGPNSGDPDDTRLVGFDNAHAAPASGVGQRPIPWDHKHRFRTVRPYDYKSAADLVADFWNVVDGVLKERGV